MTDSRPETEDRESTRPPHPPGGPQISNVWVYNGKAYDLSDWISRHPGGEFFIGRTKNRDITSIIVRITAIRSESGACWSATR